MEHFLRGEQIIGTIKEALEEGRRLKEGASTESTITDELFERFSGMTMGEVGDIISDLDREEVSIDLEPLNNGSSKYNCQDSDLIIEMGSDPTQVYISVEGDTVKIVVGVEDLKKALKRFGVLPMDTYEEEIEADQSRNEHTGYVEVNYSGEAEAPAQPKPVFIGRMADSIGKEDYLELLEHFKESLPGYSGVFVYNDCDETVFEIVR